jgi:hypothetical protein
MDTMRQQQAKNVVTNFTVFATGQTLRPLGEVEAGVRAALAALGVELLPCNWAPDPDTIWDATPAAGQPIRLVDVNGRLGLEPS